MTMHMDGDLVTVAREGELVNVPEEALRPGDTVVLQQGELVPADLRLTEASGLEVDEFDVTGAILPVVKQVEEQEAFLYAGSRITRGTARGIVIATGERTEYGNVLAQSRKEDRPAGRPGAGLGRFWMALLLVPPWAVLAAQSGSPALVSAVFLLLAGVVVSLQDGQLFDNWLLSRETAELRRFGVVVTDPRALKRMGKTDTVCFDKTGVLTTRELAVVDLYYAEAGRASLPLDDGAAAQRVKLACALCHDVVIYEKRELANPIDRAVISFAIRNGVDVQEMLPQYRRADDRPFESGNRYMASGFRKGRELWYFAKGDPDVVLKMCSRYMDDRGEEKPLDSKVRMMNRASVGTITREGGTAIALAYATDVPAPSGPAYTFLCLLHIGNPVRPGVRQVIDALALQGRRSLLLTGDREETAVKIGMETGIVRDSRLCLTGKMLDKMSSDEIARQSEYCDLFARLLPSQKGLLVRLLQQGGHRVAMVGDGPNDGIALRVSDVGISFLSQSSPIARRLSGVLLNDVSDLSRLVEGSVRVGRKIAAIHILRVALLTLIVLGPYAWWLAFR